MNPFDDPDGTFVVLVNDEEQHSLWPARMAVPAGWEKVHGPESKQSCLDYVGSRRALRGRMSVQFAST